MDNTKSIGSDSSSPDSITPDLITLAKEKKKQLYFQEYRKKNREKINNTNKLLQKQYLASYKYIKENLPTVFKDVIKTLKL